MHAGVAVLAFFMISGFVITMVIHERYGRDDAPGWRRRFAASRLMRLFPVDLVMVGIQLVWFVATDSPTVFTDALRFPVIWQALLQSLSLGIVGQDLFQTLVSAAEMETSPVLVRTAIDATPPGLLDSQWMPVGQAWSLGSELVFYALAPWIVRSVLRLCGLIAVSLLIRFTLVFGLDGYPSEIWGYYFFPSTLCFFGIGALAWHLHRMIGHMPWARSAGLAVSLIGVTAGAASVVLIGGVLPVQRATGYDTPGLWLAYIAFALGLPFVFERWKSNRVDRAVRDLSYPLYLSHGLVIGALHRVLGMPPGRRSSEALMLAAAVGVAWLLNAAVEHPVERRRKQWLAGRTTGAPIARITSGLWMAGSSEIVVLVVCAGSISFLPVLPVAEPVLVEVVDGYNLVRHDRRWFGVPHGVAVDWKTPGLEADSGITVGRSLPDVRRRVRAHASAAAEPPVLESTVGNYDIVRFGPRWLAVPHGVPVDWASGNPSDLPGARVASSRDELMSLLDSPSGPR